MLRSLVPAWALAVALIPACATQEKAPDGSSFNAVRMVASPELGAAVADYRDGRFEQAYERSRSLARSSPSPLREQASWVAGLSAYQLNRLDEAELQFMSSARSEDRRLVVDSKIMMGDVRVLQNRWSDAAQHYRDAANGLAGEERSRVLGYAEVASTHAATRAAGQAGGTTRGGSVVAWENGSNPAPASWSGGTTSNGAAGNGSYALQAGAFQSEANARRRASEIAAESRRAGLGEPRVVRTRDSNGREFWAVQVGSFPTRRSADEARARASTINFIVATAS